MCGIAGAIGAIDPKIAAKVRVMMDAQVHRGPDDSGMFESGGCPGVVFGFRRLAIIDLSADGHQPMVDRDRGNAIVFNGEIYNFAEIRRELQDLGEVLRSQGDTEVLLRAYGRWVRIPEDLGACSGEHLGADSGGSGRVIGAKRRGRSGSERSDELRLGSWLNLVGEHAFLFSEGRAAQRDDMGVVDHAVADGISHSRLDELLVPVLGRDLGGHHCGRLAIAVLQDLDQVPAFLVLERPDEEVIEHQDIELGEAGKCRRVAAVGACDPKFVQ